MYCHRKADKDKRRDFRSIIGPFGAAVGKSKKTAPHKDIFVGGSHINIDLA